MQEAGDVEALFTKWKPHPFGDDEGNSSNYIDFENHFRGSKEAKLGRQMELKKLIDSVFDHAASPPGQWLDIGCGTGILLDDVKSRGHTQTVGVESDSRLATIATEQGHQILVGNAQEILADLVRVKAKFDVISASHLIEHLHPTDASNLINNAASLLADGGILVVETPNAQDSRVMLGSFYRDPTHVRPYPQKLLEFMFGSTGLRVIEQSFYDHYGEERRSAVEDRSHDIQLIRENLQKAKRRLNNCFKQNKTSLQLEVADNEK